MYKIVFTASAAKQLKKLGNPIQKRLVEKLQSLDVKQLNNNVKKLIGIADLYRLRVGDYRIIYQVKHEELVVLVLKVGGRGDVYREIQKLS